MNFIKWFIFQRYSSDFFFWLLYFVTFAQNSNSTTLLSPSNATSKSNQKCFIFKGLCFKLCDFITDLFSMIENFAKNLESQLKSSSLVNFLCSKFKVHANFSILHHKLFLNLVKLVYIICFIGSYLRFYYNLKSLFNSFSEILLIDYKKNEFIN